MIKNHTGGKVIRLNPTLETSEYAAGDVLFDPIEIPLAVATRGGASILKNMFLIDKEVQSQDIEFYFFENSTSLGTVNATANVSNDNFVAGNFLGMYMIDSDQTDSTTIDNVHVNQVHTFDGTTSIFEPMILQAAPNSRSVYVTATCLGGTATYAADSLQLVVHVQYLD